MSKKRKKNDRKDKKQNLILAVTTIELLTRIISLIKEIMD